MSRVGDQPVSIPSGVTVEVDGRRVSAKGPKGQLQQTFRPEMDISLENGEVVVRRPSDSREHRSLHGLTRSLINNMVIGVSEGYEKKLILQGTGYRAQVRGRNLVLNVGYSHEVVIDAPDGVTFSVDKPGKNVTIEGADKQVVGELAARIRRVRPPEPYKGKGIRYADEVVHRKAGKTARVE